MNPEKKTYILVLEDDESHTELIRRSFRKTDPERDIVFTKTLRDARARVSECLPLIVIADLNLPDGKGDEIIISQEAECAFPVIIMTSFGTEDIAVDSIKKGGVDYVVKSEEAFSNLPHITERALIHWGEIRRRVNAEKELARSEAKYRDLYDNAPDMFTSVEAKTRCIVECNQTLADNLGFSKSDIIGKNIFEISHPDCHQQVAKAFRSFVETGEVRNTELQLQRKDGSKIHVSLSVSSFKDQAGKVLYSRFIWRDITEKKQVELALRRSHDELEVLVEKRTSELSKSNRDLRDEIFHRKRVEERLRQSEEHLRSVIDNAMTLIYIKDLHHRFISINPEYEKKFNLKNEEVKGKTNHEIFPKEIADAFIENDEKVLAAMAPMEFEEVAPQKDGLHTYISNKFPLYDSSGNPYAVCGISTDITERKRAEEQVHKLSEAVEQSPVSIMITDVNGTIEYVNSFFSELTGHSSEEVLGQNPRILKSGEVPNEEYKVLWEAILAGKIWRGEFHNKKRSGELYWESAIISPLLTDGKVTHFIAIREDITQKKKDEEKLKIAQKHAIVSQKLAGIGELAAGVSHEVLNPVNIISVHIQMLQRNTKDNAKTQEVCSKVRHEIGRITKIMGSLLSFSRTGEAKLEKGFIKNEVEKVLALVEDEYKLDNVKIARSWCGKPVEILYDPDKIRQVFLNLIHNAKHAMPNGGTITVGCSAIKKSGKQFHQFTFSDAGTGMGEEVRLKAFDPFFTTKPEGEGTGMGLSVVHGIIEEHGGKIRVESEEGKGTTFTISLPID